MSQVRAAALIVLNPSGVSSRVTLHPLPFLIGRAPSNHLVLRDNRTSRAHARIVLDNNEHWIEDLNSRAGVFVNGARVERAKLRDSDRISFGLRDSYELTFALEEAEIDRLLDQIQPHTGAPSTTSNLARLRALVEVARALQSSLSITDVLTAVVDAALAITGAERGFLLLKKGDDLDVRVSRDRSGTALPATDLDVPTRLIHRALHQRRELLSMNFDPDLDDGANPDLSVMHLELRSVVCVPLVRVRTANVEETSLVSAANETTGVLYMDSRAGAADLSSGGRELLQTLALEASTVLENARLLEEERRKQQLERELSVAQQIQAGLLPRCLPTSGWFRAAGSSQPSHQVGGDYFDVRRSGTGWVVVVVDVSGKGVSAAILASLLQGALLLASESPMPIDEILSRTNRILYERTEGEKYATALYCTFEQGGRMRWVNAGHCPPLLLRDHKLRKLGTGSLPVGILPDPVFAVEEQQLEPGDKLILHSDGVSEAMDAAGEIFGLSRLREVILNTPQANSNELHRAICDAVQAFAGGARQSDDLTLVVLEYSASPDTAN